MEVLTLSVAGISAFASIVAAILTHHIRIKLQSAEQRIAETSRLQPRRPGPYASLVKVLRGHELAFAFKSPSHFGTGTEGHGASIDPLFSSLANDSTQAWGGLTDYGPGTADLVDSGHRNGRAVLDELKSLSNKWMVVMLEYAKHNDERDLTDVMTGVSEAQADLATEVERLSSVIRTE